MELKMIIIYIVSMKIQILFWKNWKMLVLLKNMSCLMKTMINYLWMFENSKKCFLKKIRNYYLNKVLKKLLLIQKLLKKKLKISKLVIDVNLNKKNIEGRSNMWEKYLIWVMVILLGYNLMNHGVFVMVQSMESNFLIVLKNMVFLEGLMILMLVIIQN